MTDGEALPVDVIELPDHSSVADLLAAQHGLVSIRQARARGLSRATVARRVSSGVLDRPMPHVVRLRAVPRTYLQELLAASLSTGWRAVASHRAAASLHGLDGCPSGTIELSIERRHRTTLPGAVVHHVQALEPCDRTVIDAVPATGLARTLCDLGSVVPRERVERALDDVRRRGISLRWLQATAERLHRPGQAGTGVLLSLLEEARRQPTVRGSWFERLVEDCVGAPDLPPLVRQYAVRHADGRLAGILDLAFPTLRLGVEAHSRQFHFGPRAQHADEDRDHRLAACGWEVLYVGWQHTKRPAQLLALVRQTAVHRRRVVTAAEL
jgi:hypothetical protein